jgi:hypothetical protein
MQQKKNFWKRIKSRRTDREKVVRATLCGCPGQSLGLLTEARRPAPTDERTKNERTYKIGPAIGQANRDEKT